VVSALVAQAAGQIGAAAQQDAAAHRVLKAHQLLLVCVAALGLDALVAEA
jgi:hypothetical protein